MRFRTFALFFTVFLLSAALVAEEETRRPDEEATDATEEAVAPVLSPELQKRAAVFKRTAAYFRDAGDEERALLFEKRAAAIERGEISGPARPRARRDEPVQRPPRTGATGDRGRDLRSEDGERSPRRRRGGYTVLDAAEERTAELQKELKEAQAAGDEARVKELRERIVLLRTTLSQGTVIREQAKRIADLERDIRAIKSLLRRLATGGGDKEE